ncbi:MAG TPA: SCP2 sterol-binding domain-containing protein [Solirubrobacteraceae bacterium]|nr:SCP2 sterol-binding domain-containing protein [Solirubrobacteraceae bacterium]
MSLAATIGDSGRVRARTLLARGGERAAELSGRPATHRLFLRAVPAAMRQRFDADSARGLDTVLELRIRDPAGGAATPFTLAISNGSCTITRGGNGAARAGIELGSDDMIRLVSGGVGWPKLLAAGRLALSGDPFLGLRVPNLFRLPAG